MVVVIFAPTAMLNGDDERLIHPNAVTLSSWSEIVDEFDRLPPPKLGFDMDGDLDETAWISRGVSNSSFGLEPSVERSAKDSRLGWPALERKVAEEFKCRASVYLDRPLATESELTWLALMQHHGVPTRLLDFTLSPYIALYFAVRPCNSRGDLARVWALDSQVINQASRRIVNRAKVAERESRGEIISRRVSLNPDNSLTERDIVHSEATQMRRNTEDMLAATGCFRSELSKRGCVCASPPPSFNVRLANQQGWFLINGAEDLTLAQSLSKMVGPHAGAWCTAFDIPAELHSGIEAKLFLMNIHEQSLFPDLYGLAGLISQRIRLHWS